MTFTLRFCLGLLCAAGVAQGAAEDGAVRVWGSKDDSALLKAWARGFEAAQPGRKVVLDLRGGETPLIGVYTGVAEVALLTREVRVPAETMAFTWAWRYPMTTISVANAAADTSRPNGDLAVWVNARNPRAQITLEQLDGIFGAEAKRHGSILRNWDQLGGTGSPNPLSAIHVYGPPVDSVGAVYLRHAVLADSYKWNPELHEMDSDAALLSAVAGDENAITIAPRHGAPAGVKALAISASPSSPFVELSTQTAGDRTYPLSRVVIMAINRTPGKPVAPATLAWLHYVLSLAGQAVVAANGTCLPLTPKQIKSQQEKLQ